MKLFSPWRLVHTFVDSEKFYDSFTNVYRIYYALYERYEKITWRGFKKYKKIRLYYITKEEYDIRNNLYLNEIKLEVDNRSIAIKEIQ